MLYTVRKSACPPKKRNPSILVKTCWFARKFNHRAAGTMSLSANSAEAVSFRLYWIDFGLLLFPLTCEVTRVIS